MKKAVIILCMSFFVTLIMFVTITSDAIAGSLTVKINNYANKKVCFAFARENAYNPSENSTKGWWCVNARTSKTIHPYNYHQNNNYYWSATIESKPIVKSNDFSGWVTHQAFTVVNGRKPAGGRRIGFKVLNNNKGTSIINIGKN